MISFKNFINSKLYEAEGNCYSLYLPETGYDNYDEKALKVKDFLDKLSTNKQNYFIIDTDGHNYGIEKNTVLPIEVEDETVNIEFPSIKDLEEVNVENDTVSDEDLEVSIIKCKDLLDTIKKEISDVDKKKYITISDDKGRYSTYLEK